MTRKNRAFHVVRGLSVFASSLALVLAAVATTAAHPATVVHVATSLQTGSLRDNVTARILLIDPGITADELDEVVDEIVDNANEADEADEPEVDEPDVDEPDAADVDDGDTDEVDQPDAADDDQGEDADDQGEDADDGGADQNDEPEDADDDSGTEGDGD